MTYTIVPSDEYLEHHGILGQKWGVRRYQNPDGTLTSAGKHRKTTNSNASEKNAKGSHSLTDQQKANIKKTIKVGAAAAGTALAVYGTYKLAKSGKLADAAKVGKTVVEKAIKDAPNKAKKAAVGAKNVAKESVKNAGQNFVKGIPKGAGAMGEKIGVVAGGGITLLGAKKIADLVIGEDTDKIIMDAYNAYQKKENKVKNPD